MKISQLCQDIIQEAEDKFGVSNWHMNDNIDVSICPPVYHDGFVNEGVWQVSLSRPTWRQLNGGTVDDCATVRVAECKFAFYTEASSLLQALKQLQVKVSEADADEFCSEAEYR